MNLKSIVGFSSSALAVGITLTDVEQSVRVASAVVGLLIAIVMLIANIRKIWK